MPKHAISVTLDVGNLTWLKACARVGRGRSVSDVLDRLVTEARARRAGGEVTSVVGTVDVDPSDPLLLRADAALHGLFAGSLGRPVVVQEERARYGKRTRKRRG